MDNNQNDVVFHEDDVEIRKKILLSRNERSEDRIIGLITKISGGRIHSKKIATFIVLLLAGIMIALSIFWFTAI